MGIEPLITPVLAILLYGMFAQIPFLHLRDALADRRFLAAVLVTNFVLVPVLVGLLIQLLPDQPPLLLGVLLVLLTPCIDYVVVFTHLGGGNARLMLAATPVLLLAQLVLLPLYLWLFMGGQAVAVMKAEPFLAAFTGLIVIPLLLALATESWAKRRRSGRVWLKATAWLPVPFMALTLLIIVASQIGKIEAQLPWVAQAIPLYIAFLVVAPLLALVTGRVFGLETRAGRALTFSTGTRNSLVVLPLALALPEAWSLTAVVIVTQTLVELVGELFYIRLVPKLVWRASSPDTAS